MRLGRLGRRRVRLHRDDRRALGDGRRHRVGPGEHRLRRLHATAGAGPHVHGVGDEARTGLHREPRGHLLALRRRRDEDGRGRRLLDQLGEQLGLRDDEEVDEVGRLRAVDLLGAVCAECRLGLLVAVADEHSRGLAEAAGDGQQLGRGLADVTARVVDEDENFSHVCESPCQQTEKGSQTG
jgi:hypothetical protein